MLFFLLGQAALPAGAQPESAFPDLLPPAAHYAGQFQSQNLYATYLFVIDLQSGLASIDVSSHANPGILEVVDILDFQPGTTEVVKVAVISTHPQVQTELLPVDVDGNAVTARFSQPALVLPPIGQVIAHQLAVLAQGKLPHGLEESLTSKLAKIGEAVNDGDLEKGLREMAIYLLQANGLEGRFLDEGQVTELQAGLSNAWTDLYMQ